MREPLKESYLVVGFAVTGQAAARELVARGCRVVAVDDGERQQGADRLAAELGIRLVWGPSRGQLAELAAGAERIVLSPGVPPSHAVFSVADPGKIVAEIELAAALSEVALVAITGTNGKTTVTSLATEMLRAAGRRAEAVGNIGRPFVEAVADGSAEVFVCEVSSFQLAWTKTFAPHVACWLNFAEDHLDWHATMEEYAAAKAMIWRNQTGEDVAVVNGGDPVVMQHAAAAPGRLVTFGAGGEVTAREGAVVAGEREVISLDELPRSLPHDVSNTCAAVAVAMAAGADAVACAAAARRGVPMPHRIELVGTVAGVSYYDDSKATTPSAVLAALSGFPHAVLIAGGRNKGLDIGAIPRALAAEGARDKGAGLARLRGVVAVGESAGEVASVFSTTGVPVRRAGSMGEAVAEAAELAEPGDAVLLSPGCASFDWYRNYGERGDDFARLVRGRMAREAGRPCAVGAGGDEERGAR